MKWAQGIDKLGLSLYLLLCIFAVANIYSVEPSSGTRQAVWLGVSIFVGIIIFFMRAKFFENMSGLIYIAGVLLLVGLFPFGTEILGQKNWYKFGAVSLQPVEFAKIGTALMLANYVSGPDFNLKYKKSIWTSLGIIGVPAIVVLMIPDVGSLLVFIAFFIALFREGMSGWVFGVGLIFASVFLVALAIDALYVVIAIVLITAVALFLNSHKIHWNVLSVAAIIGGVGILSGLAFGAPTILEKLPKHQRERIEVLYKGERAFRDTSGYNLLYSKTAIGSGGFFGKGYREGSVTQGKFVPEQSTDYIFCTVGEEWGFFGSAMLVILYSVFIGRIYYLSEKQKSAFNRVFGYSFASILLMHFSINLGMVMGLFPTVGIPLPFFSYGGSSLLAFSMMTFIFFKLNYTDRNSLV
ncbi:MULTISPECIES: rod shape-determining protein RodA [unclassified Kaistella]|uniref:rod shape-determining protein RodA n=1 Tax=unclassified Kaistella TaxID=2762626 RepID=UPI0027357393|nr:MULTISPECIES: rod shape-determining protein RodA [unclassified Kaistella]MDP2452885.1 rod shape-determining protein RodA [Kaistella sp. SH11-4b]MDP2455794.1 rod shape-determining protein RodA [Kaistella sp. SH40-3]MDP2458698.1 rod shape-determining protein RodA [Kaistella sp. SH19-2b]